MNRQILIDQLVRQTMILIAQLATTGGTRAPLAHLADRIFLDLARELEAHGLSRKVAVDRPQTLVRLNLANDALQRVVVPGFEVSPGASLIAQDGLNLYLSNYGSGPLLAARKPQ
jgi:hypothetical protein